jgi:lactate dehydrogenase-like 2-hydroxyacid dehydrogenase
MKKVAFFDTKPYDKESFDRLNNGRYEIRYFETRLTAAALPLADGCDAACAFVNAEIDRAVVEGLVKRGIKVLAMRCAGYNNVDFKAAYEAGLTVVRVPAYSPYAVAEHAAALLMTLTRQNKTLSLLVSMPNVIVTSHQAFLTHEALANIVETTLANLDAYFTGAPLTNEICYRCLGTGGAKGGNCPRRANGRCH